jgi:hypothetical protein
MPIKFTIYKDLRLLYTVFHGQVDKSNAIEYASLIYSNADFRYAKNTLVYLKHSKLVYNIEEIEEFAKAIIGDNKFKMRFKIAILVDSPSETVAATIYAQTILKYQKSVIVELFSTLDAALFFLDLTPKRDRISHLILNHLAEVED